MNLKDKNKLSYGDKIPYYKAPPVVYTGDRDIIGENIDSVKESFREGARKNLQSVVREVNQLCLESTTYSPTLKSLAYFSEITGFESNSDKAQKLLVSKNPIAFGVGVYLETARMLELTNSRLTYRTPSQKVGFEFASQPILDRSNIEFNPNSSSVKSYLNKAEEVFEDLEYVFKSLASITAPLVRNALQSPSEDLKQAISVVLDTYHKGISNYVQKGVAYTIIEDAWLVSKSPSARQFAQNMLILYNFAEANNVVFENGYPTFDNNQAEKFMQNMMTEFNSDTDYAVYSCAFENIIHDEVLSSRKRKHYMGNLIPQLVYTRLILTPMQKIKDKLIKHDELNNYR